MQDLDAYCLKHYGNSAFARALEIWGLGLCVGVGALLSRGLGLMNVYLEGRGDLVSMLINPITHVRTLLILIINLLAKSPGLDVVVWRLESRV